MSDRDQEVIKQYFILAKLEVFYQLLKWGCRDGLKTIDKCPCYQSQLKLVNSWVKWLLAWSFLIVLSIWYLFCIVNCSLRQWQDNAEKSQTDFVLPFCQKQSSDGFLDWAFGQGINLVWYHKRTILSVIFTCCSHIEGSRWCCFGCV